MKLDVLEYTCDLDEEYSYKNNKKIPKYTI